MQNASLAPVWFVVRKTLNATEAYVCVRGQNHTSCVTEHEKYALAATKPGGKAHGGAAGGGGGGGGGGGAGTEEGDAFLATRAPWRCSCCNVTTTSQETLAGHAGGKKHRNKVKATLARVAAGTPRTVC